MKKLIIISIISLLITSCFGSIDKPRTKKEFEQKIEQLEARIRELEFLIIIKDAEINNLKNQLELAQNTTFSPESATEVNFPSKVIKQPIFGIHLGESLDSLKKRKTVNPSIYKYVDEDYPSQIWDVENSDSNIKALRISTYKELIYEISIDFADASQTNYDVIKKQLQEKYLDKGDEGLIETLFSEIRLEPIIDGIQLLIKLNYDEIGENAMTLRYIHNPIFEKVINEVKCKKASKVSEQL